MSETQNAGGSQAATTVPSTPAEPTVPPGKVLVDTATWESTQRNAQRLAGMQKYYEAGAAQGIKAPEDFARLRQADDEPDEIPAPKSRAREANSKSMEEVASTVVNRTLALEKHNSALAAETALIDELVSELAPKDATDFERDLIRSAAKAKFLERAQREDNLYPENHPLHSSHYRPIGKDAQKAILSEMRDLREKSAAQAKKQKAEAAMGATLPAGRSGGQGAPQDTRTHVPPETQLRNAAIERLKELRAGRSGNPV